MARGRLRGSAFKTLQYTDPNGRVINTASSSEGAWQYTETVYDQVVHGSATVPTFNVIKSLDERGIAGILAAGGISGLYKYLYRYAGRGATVCGGTWAFLEGAAIGAVSASALGWVGKFLTRWSRDYPLSSKLNKARSIITKLLAWVFYG